MSLAGNVQTRIPTRRLRELTNANDHSASSTNTTILGLACDDVEEYFAEYCGVAYDDTNTHHVAVAVQGVVALLKAWASDNETSWEKWITRAEHAALTLGRDRFAPSSSSTLTPSDEGGEDGTEVRPALDSEAFDGYKPGMP